MLSFGTPQIPNPDSTNIPNANYGHWTGICCSREFCSLSKLTPDTPKILLSTGGGRAHKRTPRPLPKSVGQSTTMGEKNLVNGRSKKRRLKCFVFQGPLGNGHGNGHDNGHGNGHAICSLFWGALLWGSMWHWNSCRRSHVLSIAIGLIVRRLLDVEFVPIKVPHCFMDGP